MLHDEYFFIYNFNHSECKMVIDITKSKYVSFMKNTPQSRIGVIGARSSANVRISRNQTNSHGSLYKHVKQTNLYNA